jgi:hypothetical protein
MALLALKTDFYNMVKVETLLVIQRYVHQPGAVKNYVREQAGILPLFTRYNGNFLADPLPEK